MPELRIMKTETNTTATQAINYAADHDTGEAAQPETEDPGSSVIPADGGDPEKNGSEQHGWFARLFSRKRNGNSIREDLEDALSKDEGSEEGFSPEERTMLTNILRLQDIRVEELMTPRADIVAVNEDIPLSELVSLFESTGHSRMPVYGETLDDPRGMVHLRDLFAHITRLTGAGKPATSRKKAGNGRPLEMKKSDLDKPLSALKLVREILFVPPSMPAAELMTRMQAERVQIALVIDEYGGTDGLLSLEDIVEEIVGDIEDEHDDDDFLIEQKEDGVYICDAKAELDDIRELIGDSFEFGDFESDVDTIGGLLFTLIGRVPVRGEVVSSHGYEFRIMEADPRRIKRIEISRSSRKRARKS